MVFSQLCQGFFESVFLLPFNLKVLLFSLQCVLFKFVIFDFDVVKLLQFFAQLLWVTAEKVKSAGQLVDGVRKLIFRSVTMQHSDKVYPRTHRLPHIIYEVFVSALFFSGWKGVGSNQENGILVAIVEILVQTCTHLGTCTLKKQFCNMQILFFEGVYTAELLASHELCLEFRSVSLLYG